MVSLEGKSAFFYCVDYARKGPRVLLVTGGRWTEKMIAHCGITDDPFFIRDKRASEPDTYPNGHPWGWAYRVEDVTKDESRFLDSNTLSLFEAAMNQAIQRHSPALEPAVV